MYNCLSFVWWNVVHAPAHIAWVIKCRLSPQAVSEVNLKVKYSFCQTALSESIDLRMADGNQERWAWGTYLHRALSLPPPVLFSISIPHSFSLWCHLECWCVSCHLPSLCANPWSSYGYAGFLSTSVIILWNTVCKMIQNRSQDH